MRSTFYRQMTLCACLWASAAAAPSEAPTSLFPDPLPTHYRTGRRFTTALEQPISGAWKGVPLRAILRRLSHERQIAILLDRRVDPEQELQIETGDRPLRAAVNEIAQSIQLGVTQVGNCLIVAPSVSVLRLRTVIALRERELERAAVGTEVLSQVRGHRSTVTWGDFDRPSDIVSRIGRQFGLSIAGLEQIPHDLWAGATIPEATASEALSLVLNQFDLTFEWLPRESGVRLVHVPEHVAVERTYTLRGKSAPQTLRMLHSLIEGLDATAHGNKLVVRGTLEQHEMVAATLRAPKNAQPTLIKKSALPVEKEAFKLQAEGVSLQELFEELKKQGLPLEYNAKELRNAGIDLDRKVSVDLPRLPAAEFLRRLLDPHGLTFRFANGAVVLGPKSGSSSPSVP
jgi:hypothetical protein